MKPFRLSLIAVLCILSTPALADGTAARPSGARPCRWQSLPASIAGFCCGLTVGIPICLARKFGDEVKDGAAGIVGKTQNKWLLVPASLIWSPFAAVVTTAEA